MGSMESDSLERPFTATSLASAAGVDPSYIARLCRQGKIEATKFGSSWMIPYEEGRRWLERRTAESGQDAETLTEE